MAPKRERTISSSDAHQDRTKTRRTALASLLSTAATASDSRVLQPKNPQPTAIPDSTTLVTHDPSSEESSVTASESDYIQEVIMSTTDNNNSHKTEQGDVTKEEQDGAGEVEHGIAAKEEHDNATKKSQETAAEGGEDGPGAVNGEQADTTTKDGQADTTKDGQTDTAKEEQDHVLTALPFTLAITSVQKSIITKAPSSSLDTFFTDKACAFRLRAITQSAGSGTIVNLATADPDSLSTLSSKYISFKGSKKAGIFYLTGTVTHCGLQTSKPGHQICIAPFTDSWIRAVAVLGKLYAQPYLYFNSFKKGVSFGTMKQGRSDGPPYRATSSNFIPVHTSSAIIPIYDGRGSFDLQDYASLEEMTEELPARCAAIIIFTINSYPVSKNNLSNINEKLQRSVSLNIQAAICVADPDLATEDEEYVEETDPNATYEGVLPNTGIAVSDVLNPTPPSSPGLPAKKCLF
ncbi:hypothetical protein BV25DRAFT_1898412 [Artomyces pyxidatus]|uniref:Uncharacterized protein n=1 Tax=Artomyces pyxidatus TaxID=48021 RepID=A0ACB8T8L2_9AGAM|nr:hypothetical protein BV25DRAFT_1898412 [Artomyces pyxidatus]